MPARNSVRVYASACVSVSVCLHLCLYLPPSLSHRRIQLERPPQHYIRSRVIFITQAARQARQVLDIRGTDAQEREFVGSGDGLSS